MATVPITSWQIEEKNGKKRQIFIFMDSKITVNNE